MDRTVHGSFPMGIQSRGTSLVVTLSRAHALRARNRTASGDAHPVLETEPRADSTTTDAATLDVEDADAGQDAQ